MRIIDNDLLSIQEARILAENAKEAQKELANFSQEKLDEILVRMSEEILDYCEELAKLSQKETAYGRWEDKLIKNRFAAKKVLEAIKPMRCVGIIEADENARTMKVGVPVGVIAAICPATSPVSTIIYNALIAIKAGNAIVFSPHPRAKQVSAKAIEILARAAEGYGLPSGAISYLHTLAPIGTQELMNHKDVRLIINTGVPSMLQRAYEAGKPVIFGGTGSGPAFIERTADIKQAVSDIVESKTFDNGIASAAEQYVVVDSPIEDEVCAEFARSGAYFMSEEEASNLAKLFYRKDDKQDPEMLGKSAEYLAEKAGFSVPPGTKLLIAKQKYAAVDSHYLKEKLCPVLAYYVENDWRHACEKCIELLLNGGFGHTLVIHSQDSEVVKQFALKKPVGRMLVNTPAVFGSMGATTTLFPALTLGSASAGEGVTADNVSPMNLIYVRKIGCAAKLASEFKKEMLCEEVEHKINTSKADDAYKLELLEEILKML